MTNRDKYLTKRNEYDLMMDILKNSACPVIAVSGDYPKCGDHNTCSECIRAWLNEEAK